ncbi:hypothetical protein [Sediminitomix flava]|uniref:2'-5' RNA ligase n=1 Tax=Sediminitomix flava TaxID=379075 RepID=A0A315ZA92_SEDFL|nr:hypothetical protein [Sediminitomix flava]PWJ41000.1 hypothetical protein BC781_104266 [Sediminitomix flava]
MITSTLLHHKYEEIEENGLNAISVKQEVIDNYLLDPRTDNRKGLSLVVNLDYELLENIYRVLEILKPVMPNQYFYPLSDIHLTVLSVVTVNDDFRYKENLVEEYDKIFCDVIPQIPEFLVNFEGLTISNGAIIMKGFYEFPLAELREALRNQITVNGIDFQERYKLMTAHSTVVRFKEVISNRKLLLEYMNLFKNLYLGSMVVKSIDFVCHDWYNSLSKKTVLKRYYLNQDHKALALI